MHADFADRRAKLLLVEAKAMAQMGHRNPARKLGSDADVASAASQRSRAAFRSL